MEGGGNEFTGEITLRPLELSDIDDFMVWATDEKVTRFCSWEPYTNKEDAINFINTKVIPHPWYREICLNGQPIGAISMTKNSDNDKCKVNLAMFWALSTEAKGLQLRKLSRWLILYLLNNHTWKGLKLYLMQKMWVPKGC